MAIQATVLVVDDDGSVRRSLQRLLTTAGYRVVSCASADELLAVHDVPRPACIVLDIRMPGVDGLELLAALRDELAELPVILTSGHIDVAPSARATLTGVVAFLPKPFAAAQLFATIERALDRDRPGRTHAEE
jgi:FixJ family two-component response regulator